MTRIERGDRSGDLVAEDAGISDERIAAAVGVQIAATEADLAHLEQDVSFTGDLWFRYLLNRGAAWRAQHGRLHSRELPDWVIELKLVQSGPARPGLYSDGSRGF